MAIVVRMEDGAEVPLALPPAAVGAPGGAPQPAVLPLEAPGTPARITLRNPSAGPLVIQGISLIDERDGARTHQSVTLSPQGDFRRIHSGDVKVYERTGAPERAWLVHGIMPVADAKAAQAAIGDPAFRPRAQAVVEAPLARAQAAEAQAGEGVTLVDYRDERQSYRVQATETGLLVIADAWYPGWRATVDGQPAEILKANLLYRAVRIEPGDHEVVFEYAPQSWRIGVIISIGALFALALALLAALVIRLRAKLL